MNAGVLAGMDARPVRVVLGRCGHHGAARRRTLNLNRPTRAHRTGSCPRTRTGEVIDGDRSCSPADVRACRPGRRGDLVVVPVHGLDPAELCDLSPALDGVVRRTWPGPTAGRSR